jgi:DNA-binding transcriptional ArsR family regulator
MKQEGLLASRRSGKHVFYSLADQHVADLMLAVLAHAQEGHADRTPPDADP